MHARRRAPSRRRSAQSRRRSGKAAAPPPRRKKSCYNQRVECLAGTDPRPGLTEEWNALEAERLELARSWRLHDVATIQSLQRLVVRYEKTDDVFGTGCAQLLLGLALGGRSAHKHLAMAIEVGRDYPELVRDATNAGVVGGQSLAPIEQGADEGEPLLLLLLAQLRQAERAEAADVARVAQLLGELKTRVGLLGLAAASLAASGWVAEPKLPALVMRVVDRSVWFKGEQIADLQRRPQLFRLFKVIASGGASSREALFAAVWEERYRPPSSDNRVYVAIRRLRERLSENAPRIDASDGGYSLPEIGSVWHDEVTISTDATDTLMSAGAGSAMELLEPEFLGLVLAWSVQGSDRLGELFACPMGQRHLIGRGGSRPDDVAPRIPLVQHRPWRMDVTGDQSDARLSRRQLLVRATADGLELTNLGKLPLTVDGVEAHQVVVAPGGLVGLGARALFYCVRRRHPDPGAALGSEHPFGGPDAWGLIGESPSMYELRSQIESSADWDGPVLLLGSPLPGVLAALETHRPGATLTRWPPETTTGRILIDATGVADAEVDGALVIVIPPLEDRREDIPLLLRRHGSPTLEAVRGAILSGRLD